VDEEELGEGCEAMEETDGGICGDDGGAIEMQVEGVGLVDFACDRLEYGIGVWLELFEG